MCGRRPRDAQIEAKSCQPRKNRRTERLKELLSLKQSDSILLDACARKSPQDGNN
jgi:hypothetical protein